MPSAPRTCNWIVRQSIAAAILLGTLNPHAAAAQADTGTATTAAETNREAPLPTAEAAVAVPPVAATAPAAPSPQLGNFARQARVDGAAGTLVERGRSAVGLVAFIALAVLLSEKRRAIRWRIIAWGVGMQFGFGLLILHTSPGRAVFQVLNDSVVGLLGYTTEGARFIFGNLVANNVPVGPAAGPMDAVVTTTSWANTGAYFAFTVLPTIVFFSSLMAVLYHLGLMQIVVRALARIMMRTMGTSGAESLTAAGNIFVGQTEAPLLVRPFLPGMTTSELHAVMTAGFATVAGGVMAAYVGLLVGFFPDIAGHLIAASVMSAPAALAIGKTMLPETEESETAGAVRAELRSTHANLIDAAARGAAEGLSLALNVGAMLLAFIALLALGNGLLGWAAGLVGVEGLTLQRILGWIGAPLAWLMGTGWSDATVVGALIGEKTALNEFVAYLHLAEMLGAGTDLAPRSVVIATYALAGFANFSSIAVQVGGIGALAPERRSELSRIGLRAMVAGTLAAFTTACVVGVIL